MIIKYIFIGVIEFTYLSSKEQWYKIVGEGTSFILYYEIPRDKANI